MSISERLEPKKEVIYCKVGRLLRSGKLSKEDVETLEKIFETSNKEERAITNVTIFKALKEEGFDIGNTTISRHRMKNCCCYSVVVRY